MLLILKLTINLEENSDTEMDLLQFCLDCHSEYQQIKNKSDILSNSNITGQHVERMAPSHQLNFALSIEKLVEELHEILGDLDLNEVMDMMDQTQL